VDLSSRLRFVIETQRRGGDGGDGTAEYGNHSMAMIACNFGVALFK
jgi:hypothetical protein